ncbi:hypothetical protein C0J52_10983 [Blattella germanica]|nr:hypothetical protein C0J52_10983 [Blattella germanica]
MPLDDLDNQGQKNTDVLKSVGLLLMSSMEVSRLEQRAYIKKQCFAVKIRENVTHNANILHDLIPKLKAPLHGRRSHTQEDIAKAVRHEITRLDNGQWSN